MPIKVIRLIAILSLPLCCEIVAAGSFPALERRDVPLEVFVREGSPRSVAARAFIEENYSDRKGVTLVFRDVTAEQAALDRFWKLADHFKVQRPGLPAFYVAGRFESGWNSETTPKWLEESLTVEVFVRQGRQHCKAAHPVLFDRLAPRYPGLTFVERDLLRSKEATLRLQQLSARYRVQAVSVPTVHLGGRLIVGFRDEETSFREWDRVLRLVTTPSSDARAACGQSDATGGEMKVIPAIWQNPIAQQGRHSPARLASIQLNVESATNDRATDPPEIPPRSGLPPESEPTEETVEFEAEDDLVTLPLVGDIHWRDWGMPAFTLGVGLIDGFNPCAMWVLLFLLSVLVNLKDRWKILAVAGTFVMISGLAYFAFMAAWLNVFQIIGLLRPAQIALGLLGATIGAIHVKDFFAFKKGVSLSIPEAAKPGLYSRVRRIVTAENISGAILGASVLAILVNVIELLCTAGLPAMYTGILAMQEYPPWANYLYLALYIAGYMFDDSLMVGLVVVTLGRHKLQERGGRLLKLISGLVILVLSGLMIFKPEWLV